MHLNCPKWHSNLNSGTEGRESVRNHRTNGGSPKGKLIPSLPSTVGTHSPFQKSGGRTPGKVWLIHSVRMRDRVLIRRCIRMVVVVWDSELESRPTPPCARSVRARRNEFMCVANAKGDSAFV
jgi:hypothetical protein